MPDASGAADLSRPQPPEPEEAAPVTLEQAQQEYTALDGKHLGRYAELVALRNANTQDEQDLARYQGAQIPPWEATKMMFRAFLDHIWPLDSPDGAAQRLAVDLQFQQMLAAQWEGLGKAAAQQRLAQGGQLPPELAQRIMDAQLPPGLRSGNHS